MRKESQEEYFSRMDEVFFLQYHLGMRYDKIKAMSDHDRKLTIELFCKENNKKKSTLLFPRKGLPDDPS